MWKSYRLSSIFCVELKPLSALVAFVFLLCEKQFLATNARAGLWSLVNETTRNEMEVHYFHTENGMK